MNDIQPAPEPVVAPEPTAKKIPNRFTDGPARIIYRLVRYACMPEGNVRRFINSDNVWGVMNLEETPLSKHRFSYIAPFVGDLAEARLDKKQVMINRMNVPVTDSYDCIVPEVIPRRSIMWNDGKCLLINSTSQMGFGKWYDGFAVNQGVLTMKQGKMWVIVDEGAKELHERVEAIGVFSAGLAIVRLWDSWNYLTARGEFLLREWLPHLPVSYPAEVTAFYERQTP